MNADTSAVFTNTDVYTKSACFTVHDMISCFSMMSRRAIPLFIRIIVVYNSYRPQKKWNKQRKMDDYELRRYFRV